MFTEKLDNFVQKLKVAKIKIEEALERKIQLLC